MHGGLNTQAGCQAVIDIADGDTRPAKPPSSLMAA
jgi:hypothetical protein